MAEGDVRLDMITDADFSSRVGHVFRMKLGDAESIDLVLTHVTPHPYPSPNPKRRGFSLTFRSSLPGAAPQAIYTLVHDEMGVLKVFLVPIGPHDGGMRYEAVFN